MLWANGNVIPTSQMTLAQQMNAYTRIIVLMALCSLPLRPQTAMMFLGVAVVFIIILYFCQKRKMATTEHFTVNPTTGTIERSRPDYIPPIELTPNAPNGATSANQALAGPPNPKTRVPPVVVPPPAALDYWKANNLVSIAQINTAGVYDTFASGYDVTARCEPPSGMRVPITSARRCPQPEIKEGYETEYIGISDPKRPVNKPCAIPPATIVSPVPTTEKVSYLTDPAVIKEGYSERQAPLQPGAHRPILSPVPTTSRVPYLKNPGATVKEGYTPKRGFSIPQSGEVNTSCGYNPTQVKYGVPVNASVGPCEKTKRMTDYNKQLYTQTIQPGMYTTNDVIEPINANMGISFTQQFAPVSCQYGSDGLMFKEHNPATYTSPPAPKAEQGPAEANVYDPRHSGYGTGYRSYVDNVTGQPRFFYDDVNSIRMPNYISRSNIDFARYADSYGPLTDSNRNGNPQTSSIRALAQDSWLRSSLQYRTDLSERLMRKRNSEMWQLRKYPTHNRGSCGTKC